MVSLETVQQTAAGWVARRGGEGWNEADEAQLQRWLDASTGNLIAFMRVQAAWKEADRLKVLGAGFPPGYVPRLEDLRASPFFRHLAKGGEPAPVQLPGSLRRLWRRMRLLAAAASMVVVVGAGLWAWSASRPVKTYSTPVGVTAAVPLSDGSRITLNTDTEIRVAVTERERRVELEQGEAFFEVVSDPLRPFVVAAGVKRVVVLGTKFSVRRDRDGIRVVVTEGKVALLPARGAQPPVAAPAPQPHDGPGGGAIVAAGAIAQTSGTGLDIRKRPLTEAEELLSWRSGYVVFHETPLTEAVAEFNRYNSLKLVVKGGAVADIRISGNFRSTNVDSFVRLLEDGFPVTVERQGERIVLKRRAAE